MHKNQNRELRKVAGWEFIDPENPDKFNPIHLLCPDILLDELAEVSRTHDETPIMVDGDVIPGKQVLKVITESVARYLIRHYGATVVDPGEFEGEKRGFVYTSSISCQ